MAGDTAQSKHADTDPAVSVCFTVTVDGKDLGFFSTCDGLGVELVMEQREEGGSNGFVWQLPSRLKYTNVKLSRAVGKDSSKVTDWLIGYATEVEKRRYSSVTRGRVLQRTATHIAVVGGRPPAGPSVTTTS